MSENKKTREVVKGDILLCTEELRMRLGQIAFDPGTIVRVVEVTQGTLTSERLVALSIIDNDGVTQHGRHCVTPSGWLKSFKILTARHTPTMHMDVDLHVVLPPQHIDIDIDFGEFFATSDPYKELKEAYADGKTIELRVYGNRWAVMKAEPQWTSSVENYRIFDEYLELKEAYALGKRIDLIVHGTWTALALKLEPKWSHPVEHYRIFDEYRELKESYADGKTIEVLAGDVWLPLLSGEPSFAAKVEEYRIRPDHADWDIDDVINCAYEENAVGIIAHYAGENADGKPSVFVDGLSSKTSDRLQEEPSTAHYKFMRKVS